MLNFWFFKYNERIAKGDTSDLIMEIWKGGSLGKGEEDKYEIRREVGEITIGI